MSSSRLKKGAALTVFVCTLVGGFEGLRTAAYRDPVGIPTICFGETRDVRMGQRRTRAECDGMLLDSLRRHEAAIRPCLARSDELPDPTYVALLSFAYNIGPRAFCGSTLVRRLNAGDLKGACNELLRWDRAAGVRLAGLARRRQEERALCLHGLQE